MPLRLLVTIGPDMGKVFDLAPGQFYVLGRGEDCDVRLSDPRVSRHHCRITVEGGRATIEDLNSSWGTVINGNKIESRALQPNDLITLVESELRFEVAADATAATWGPGSDVSAAPPKAVSSTPKPPSKAVKQLPPEKKTAPPPPSLAAAPLAAPSLEKLVGRTLHRFEIQDVLARAKSGIVFRGRDTKQGRPVALKVLWPEFSQNDEDMQRFVRAIKSMAGIRHPNLVRVYGAGKTGPYCWTASELLDADSLADRIEQASGGKGLPWKQVLEIAVDIANGLAAAAEHQVVHRNITPKNILVDRGTGSAKLGDLMFAKALEGGQAAKITRPGETVGELPFLAPEQLLARGQIDERADIYSLGATLYAALTGRPPLVGNSLSETLRKIETAEPPKPSEFVPSLPGEFEAVLLRMLAKNPDDRFRSASELLAELMALARVHGLAQSKHTTVPIEHQPPTPAAAVPKPPSAPASGSPEGDWAPLVVEEESVTARLQRKAKKPVVKIGKSDKRTKWLIAGGAGVGALVLLIGLWAAGIFGGKSSEGPDATAKNKKSQESEPLPETDPLAFSGDNLFGASTKSPFGEPEFTTVTDPMELPKLIQFVEPSVARIDVTSLEGESNGSGFVVDSEGTLVTNFHVIDGADRATAVFADGKQVRVEGAWHIDPERDIAILKLNTFGIDLKPLKLAENLPPKGESVVAFGAPLGFDFTASQGIVSGIRRPDELENIGIEGHLGTWVQTTAPISPGNSGGPLVNRRGEVVAVNTLTFIIGQNLNLAISARDVRSALGSRSAEPTPLSELSKNSLLAEFGLSDNPEAAPAEVAVDPEILARIKRLAAEGEKPLKTYAEQSGPLYADQKKEWQRQIPKAYETLGSHSPRWDDHAKVLMRFREGQKLESLREAAEAIVQADCQDPAALMLSALLHMPEPEALDVGKRAAMGLSDSKYPYHIRYQLRLMFFAIQAQFPDERENLLDTMEQVQSDYLQLLRDPGLSDLDRRMSYNEARKILGTIIHQDEMEFLKQLDSLDGIDPWLKEMLSGLIHHKLAWRARGSGYANTVTEQQWEVFRLKLAQAQSHWLKAWKLKPDYPEAATELLKAAMAGHGVAGEGERFWLERAVDAQFDYEPAYEAYLWAIRPRWGGSHEKMLAFGRECQATGRFDTTVPWQFHQAVQDVASELGEDGSNIYRRLGIADDYLAIIQGYREQVKDPGDQKFYDSQMACVLLLAGRKEEAKKIVDRLGDNIDERGFETFEVDPASMLDQLNP